MKKLFKYRSTSIYGAICWYILRVIFLYALLFWGWSHLIPSYIGVVTTVANKALQVLGLIETTRLAPSELSGFDVGVYHRRAANMQATLFAFKLESIHSHFPMLLALVFAMPISLIRRLKAALIGILIICFIDSVACVNSMAWSYIFMPEQHRYTPFSDSSVRAGMVNFFYYFYNAIGTFLLDWFY